jgi:hypothetical protein
MEHDGKRCDCLGGGVLISKECHRLAHRKRNPRWTLNKDAAKEFGKSSKLTEEESNGDHRNEEEVRL